MDVTSLLTRLTKVRGKNGAWIACCPAHEDSSPSLTVKELQDGRILMHCFAGCGTDAIMGVLGLAMADLFPEPLTTYDKPRLAPLRAFSAADALRCLSRESAVLAIMAHELASGEVVSDETRERAAMAAGRINECLEFTCGA